MKRYFLTAATFMLFTYCLGQTDTIFSNNQKIPCSVKEVTQDAVKYAYPGEDILNSIYKNSVQKIVYKSGRTQVFAEGTSYKKVSSPNDYENVTITQVESEVKGIFKLGDVSSKAKGTTIYSNQERVKERAYRKFKMEAAIMGANVIYLTNQRTEGNKGGGYYQSGSSSEASLSGVAYTNILPNYDDYIKLISNRKEFLATVETSLQSSSSDMSQSNIKDQFTIDNISNDNGLIMIDGKLEGVKKYSKFRVVSFSNDSFNIYYEDKNTLYNIKVKL